MSETKYFGYETAPGSFSVNKRIIDHEFPKLELHIGEEEENQINQLLRKDVNVPLNLDYDKRAINFLISQLAAVKAYTKSKDEKNFADQRKVYYEKFLKNLNEFDFNNKAEDLMLQIEQSYDE